MTGRKPVLLLDLDNTILDFDIAEERAMQKMLRERGIDPTKETLRLFRDINNRHWELMEEGKITRSEVLIGRFRTLFEALGVALDAQSAEESYAAHLCEGHYFVPGAQALLENLYPDFDLYIVSNGNAKVQDARLASSGISKYFQKIFISEAMGADKPSRAFFELCFAQIPGFDPARALIIGDSLTSDIRGGINACVKTCWFNPKGKAPRADIPADYMVKSLNEIPDLVRKSLK